MTYDRRTPTGWFELISKYGATTIVTGVLLSLTSLFGYNYIGQQQENHKLQLEQQRLAIRQCLSPDATYMVTEGQVWFHSEGKLKELRGIMVINHIYEFPEETRTKIDNLLKRRTSVYVQALNALYTPIPQLGSWWVNNFEFPEFVQAVDAIIFREMEYSSEQQRLLLIHEKIDQIRQEMLKFQSQTNSKLLAELQRVGKGSCQ